MNEVMDVDISPLPVALIPDGFCVVCEDQHGKDLRPLSDKTAQNLSTNINEFYKKDVLTTRLDRKIVDILPKVEDLETALKGRDYKIHKNCYDKFNPTHLKRALDKLNKAKKKTTRKTRSQCPSASTFAESCMFCGEPSKDDPKHPDRSNPLHAAARHKKSSSYVDEFTENVRKMATHLGDTKLLLNVFGNDVRCSELFYHHKCFTSYKRDYNNAIKNKRNDELERNRAFHEFIIWNIIKDHVDDAKNDSFDLLELEKMYINKFAERGEVVSSHITRFASKIESANIGLTIVQNKHDGKYRALKPSA